MVGLRGWRPLFESLDVVHARISTSIREDANVKIGELITVARECRGWSLREMEKRTGISHALLSQIETGHIKSPSWRNVVKIAKALNPKLDRLAACD